MPRPKVGPGALTGHMHQFSTIPEEVEPAFSQRNLSEKTSPLSKYIETEHQQAGLFSLPAFAASPDGALGLQKKRRKKCGACAPCLRRENCGSCANCLNRKTGKQICKLRKCEQLKKRQHEWEVEYFEDNSRDSWAEPELAAETVQKVISVDGPRSGGQMEIGSHDRLQEGALSLKVANGVNNYPSGDGTSIETEQQRTGSVPPRPWVSGQCKVSDTQEQQPCWNGSHGANPVQPVHHAAMEDAHNLVAFSAIAGSLPPSSSSPCNVQLNTAQLYERFSQEMGSNGAQARLSAGTSEGSAQPPEDLKTLQTALSQAKHGHKPPNCDCDGPDCPDYLDWLKKKIKLASNENQGACKVVDTPQHLQPHLQQPHLQNHPQQYPQLNGGQRLPTSYPQQQQGSHLKQATCSKSPIPCSPQVLSIAKEKNISLQAAIAIEALTQLSGTGPQAPGSPGHAPFNSNFHHQHRTQNLLSCPPNGSSSILSPPGSQSSSSRSQSVPPGSHSSHQTPVSSELHRPQSQGQPPHVTPLPSSTSPFPGQGKHPGPNSQHWQQGSGKSSEQRKLHHSGYNVAPHGSSNPMSELKQLLGDTTGKFSGAPFKLPVTQQPRLSQNGSLQTQDNPALARIKQEPDSGEHYHHTAPMGNFSIANCQQQGQNYPGIPLSPGQTSISHSTQAALQQHLHYKRNLFSNHSPSFGAPGPRASLACQNLKKWWPQGEGFPHLPIKQEPKKKKSNQGSPVIKSMSGMLAGPPLPKPKQIIIKKTKQKASMPTFLPHAQISIQKPALLIDRAPGLTNLQPGFLPPQPLHCNSTQAAAAGLPAPAQSQVSISNSPTTSSILSAEGTPTLVGPPPSPVVTGNAQSAGAGGQSSSNTSTTTSLTSTSSSSTSNSQLPSLVNVDPKYEELIRQFEAEFGESHTPHSKSLKVKDSTPEEGSLSQSSPTCPNPTPTPNPDPNDQMEVGKDESGIQCETAPVGSRNEGTQEGSLQVSVVPEKQQQPGALESMFSTPGSPLPKRMKIETSGDIAVLSTTCYSEEDTPTKDSLPSSPSLRGFLESPLRYLDTPTKTLFDTPSKDLQAEFPTCTCVEQILEKDEGPYYNHLGAGPTVAAVRDLMERRTGLKGDAIRLEKVVYTGREGKSSQGCPIAKWVIRRGNETEKLLCLVRERAGHHCPNAVIIIVILAWEGVPRAMADMLYRDLSDSLTKYGNPTSRRCGFNDDRTCACQGKDPEKCGASFSFGCSWSMYFNGCKYARSKMPRKFRLQGERPEEEDKVRDRFQALATHVAPLYKQLAPQAYSNQCQTESKAPDCRLGLKEGRPFSGVTACMDFCAHAHKDQHNLYNGCTVVCTLTKEDNREVKKIPDDEQLHVLPLYKVSLTDEFGREEGQRLKMKTGAIQVLQAFRREVRKLPEPAKSCRQRRLEAKKASSEKKKNKLMMQQTRETPDKTVVKAEISLTASPQPQVAQGHIKQEVKPNIKKEHLNGAVDGYPVQAADMFNNMCPHPTYYARGGLPPPGQPSASDPNSFHHNLPAMHNGYYNYPPNALFARKLRTYEGRNAAFLKADVKTEEVDKKPDVQSLQARLAEAFPGNASSHGGYSQPASYSQSRPSSASSEASNRGTPVIKQEPLDVPVYEGATPGRATPNTPSTTPQPAPWPGHRINGSIGPQSWERHLSPKPRPEASIVNPDQPQFPQQPSPFPHQWSSFPNAAMPPAPASPSLQVPPSPSHPGPGLPGNLHQSSTPRPSTPRSGTPQPDSCRSGAVTPQPGTPGPGTPRHWASPSPSPQPNAWAMGPVAYSPALKHSNPAGACPDKIWSKTGENRCSTPLGLQEKAWKSCGGSMAGSTPSPAPEGRLFPDALQKSDQACWNPGQADSDAMSTKGLEEDEEEVWSDSEHNFLDPNIGGVAVAPAHGSILIECARRELHATTPLKKPDRSHPTRISLVFYQHKNLNQPMHGLGLWEAKMKLLAERALQRQQEAALLGLSQEDIKALGKKRKWGAALAGASPGPGQSKDKREGPVTRLAPTVHTTSVVTVSPYAFTRLTGPYSHFV